MVRTLITVSVVAMLATAAFAYTPITMYDADYRSGTVGASFGAATSWGHPLLKYYADPVLGGTYVGPSNALPYQGAAWANSSSAVTFSNTTLNDGYVFVYQIAQVQDVVAANNTYPYFGQQSGFSMEASAGTQVVKSSANVTMQGIADDYSQGYIARPYTGTQIPAADVFMPQTLTDASLPGLLDGEINYTFVFGPSAVGGTAASRSGPGGNYGQVFGTAFTSTIADSYIQCWNQPVTGNITRSTATGGAQDVAYVANANDRLGLRAFSVKQYKNADFDLTETVDVDDALIMFGNWDTDGTATGKNFFQGDSDGSGVVDVDDALNMFGGWDVAADAVAVTPSGNAEAVYNPATGHIFLTLPAGLTTWKVGNHSGTAANFITANMVNWTTAGTLRTKSATKMGETTTGELNAVTSFDLGQVAVNGLAQGVLDLSVGWLGGSITVPVTVPEPATMALLALGGLGILARRRRA